MSEWIKVTERLPEVDKYGKSEPVLVAVACMDFDYMDNDYGVREAIETMTGYDIMGIAQWREKGVERYWSNSDLPCPLTDITHWATLPEPPVKDPA